MATKTKSQKCKKPRFLAVDFFCGAGGTTRGLIDAGGYVIAGIDKDDRCRSTYVGNNRNRTLDRVRPRFLGRDVFPKSSRYPAGGQEELFTELLELIPEYCSKVGGVPLLFAICAPCQPFTTLSRKELTDDRKAGRRRDRNLLSEATRFVAAFKPELVLSENVQGIGDPKYGGVWENFRKELKDLGYITGTKVVCTSRFGIPQYRRRSILLAAKRSVVRPERFTDLLGEELLVPENDPDSLMVSVREAIGHLPPIKAGEQHPDIPNHRTRALSDLNYRRLSAAKPGESNAYMENTPDGDLSLDCHKKVNARIGGRCFTERLYAYVSGPAFPDHYYKVPQHLKWSLRSLRHRSGTRHLASRGRDSPVVPEQLRLLSDGSEHGRRVHDRKCSPT